MGTALDRLSKIVDLESYVVYNTFTNVQQEISDIQEVVALAKQQSNIDAMRFEAAKAAMQGLLSNTDYLRNSQPIAERSLEIADALIAELQKTK
jgi:uncharacterized protein YqgQ